MGAHTTQGDRGPRTEAARIADERKARGNRIELGDVDDIQIERVSPDAAAIDAGTSWSRSSRLRALTMISSSAGGSAPDSRCSWAEAVKAVASEAKSGDTERTIHEGLSITVGARSRERDRQHAFFGKTA